MMDMGLNPLAVKSYSVIWSNLEVLESQSTCSHSCPETPNLTVFLVSKNPERSNSHFMSTQTLVCHNLEEDNQTEEVE